MINPNSQNVRVDEVLEYLEDFTSTFHVAHKTSIYEMTDSLDWRIRKLAENNSEIVSEALKQWLNLNELKTIIAKQVILNLETRA